MRAIHHRGVGSTEPRSIVAAPLAPDHDILGNRRLGRAAAPGAPPPGLHSSRATTNGPSNVRVTEALDVLRQRSWRTSVDLPAPLGRQRKECAARQAEIEPRSVHRCTIGSW